MSYYNIDGHAVFKHPAFIHQSKNFQPGVVSLYSILSKVPKNTFEEYFLVSYIAHVLNVDHDDSFLTLENEHKILSSKYFDGYDKVHLSKLFQSKIIKHFKVTSKMNRDDFHSINIQQSHNANTSKVTKKQQKLEWYGSVKGYLKFIPLVILSLLSAIFLLPHYLCPVNYIGECNHFAIVPNSSLSRIIDTVVKDINVHPETFSVERAGVNISTALVNEIVKLEFKYVNVSFCCFISQRDRIINYSVCILCIYLAWSTWYGPS